MSIDSKTNENALNAAPQPEREGGDGRRGGAYFDLLEENGQLRTALAEKTAECERCRAEIQTERRLVSHWMSRFSKSEAAEDSLRAELTRLQAEHKTALDLIAVQESRLHAFEAAEDDGR